MWQASTCMMLLVSGSLPSSDSTLAPETGWCCAHLWAGGMLMALELCSHSTSKDQVIKAVLGSCGTRKQSQT